MSYLKISIKIRNSLHFVKSHKLVRKFILDCKIFMKSLVKSNYLLFVFSYVDGQPAHIVLNILHGKKVRYHTFLITCIGNENKSLIKTGVY